uniref:Uncharacterized protein n=1 Tax=Tanacetum cinerariifolium TaxID=118510 RepID=A0A699HI32_TANCI|nr:hypothetical protein [Tanacetum cinerariifolium]
MIPFELEREAFEPERREEFNDFLKLYPIPSEYRVILPKSNQTIFDAPHGFIYLGSTLLVVPRSPLLLLCARLMVLSPLSVLQFVSCCGFSMFKTPLSLPSIHNFFLSKTNLIQNPLKDKFPSNIKEKPMFQRLGRYPTSVHVFLDPILFLVGLKPSWEYGQQRPAIMAEGKEMAFRNFIYTEDVEDLSFFPKGPSSGFSTGSPFVLVNTEPLKADEELVIRIAEVMADSRESLKPEFFVVHRGSVAAQIKDRKCKTSGVSSRPPDDVPYLTVFVDDEDVAAYRLKIYVITPPAWKNHLDMHMDVELLDLLDHCYARQAVADNVVNKRAKEEECEELRAKYEAVMTEFEKNPTVVALQEKISTLFTEVKEHKVTYLDAEKESLKAIEVSLRKKVEELKQDMREVVLKFIPYAAIELVHSDDMGSLIVRLVSSHILYKRCRAYEQVADMKEPFDLSKVKGYRSSYKKDHTQASTDLATVYFSLVG